MALVNRDKDASEQRVTLRNSFAATATGLTLPVAVIPYACTLDAARLAVFGVSGAPTYDFTIQRFIVGTGITIISAGFTTLAGTEFGTSGLQSVVTVAAGNTLLNLLANDVINVTTGASNAAAKAVAVDLVVKAIQDIKTSFGA